MVKPASTDRDFFAVVGRTVTPLILGCDCAGAGLIGLLMSRRLLLVFRRGDRKAHGAHETHVVDLLAGMDFHFVSAGLPVAVCREQLEIAGLVFQGDVHGIFSDYRLSIQSGYLLGIAAPE